jgi:hypothetical protein
MQMLLEEEDREASREASKKASKASLKRAKKKAAAKQAAGAAASVATVSAAASTAGATEPNPPPVNAAGTQAPASEPSTTPVTAMLRPAVPAAEATGGVASAVASRQSAADWMICPLSKVVMEDPVLCSDGSTYNRAAITVWLGTHGAISPMTSQPLSSSNIIPNHTLRNMIEAKLQQQTRGSW